MFPSPFSAVGKAVGLGSMNTVAADAITVAVAAVIGASRWWSVGDGESVGKTESRQRCHGRLGVLFCSFARSCFVLDDQEGHSC